MIDYQWLSFPVLAVCLALLLVLVRRQRTRPAEWCADMQRPFLDGVVLWR